MRSMKRVLIGSLAAASSSASRASVCEIPSTSNRMRPGLIRPLCALRNLVRIGCSMTYSPFLSIGLVELRGVAARAASIALRHLLVLRHWVVFHDLALEYPHLDPAGAVGGEGGGDPVIDV